MRIAQPLSFAAIILAHLLLAWCYPRFPLGPLVFVVPCLAFWATASLSPARAFRYHFFGGVVFNGVMFWWLYNVMKVGPAAIIFIGLIALVLFLSLFNAVMGWLFRHSLDWRAGLAVYPFAWAGLEVLRGYGQMSFPWSHIGYTLGEYAPLIQAAHGVGVFGLSVAIIGANILFFQSLRAKGNSRLRLALVGLSIPLLLWGYGAWRLSGENPLAESIDIALVQPSIAQVKKWDENYFQEVMEKTWKTMDAADLQGTELIVLPETAVPDFLRLRPEVLGELRRRSARMGVPILFGSLDLLRNDREIRPHFFYNSAFLLSPDSAETPLQYSKIRLVPFSERVPFEEIFPLVNYVNLGDGGFSPGVDYALWGETTRFSPSICYELIYPDFVRGARHRGAELLVNITNDSWFGISNAAYMHANIARFRTVETGAPMARVANSGVSVFYDYKGRNLGETRLFEKTVLRRKLPVHSERTFYLTTGGRQEGFYAVVFLGILVLTVVKGRRQKRLLRNQSGNKPARTAAQ